MHRRYYVQIKCQLDATDDIYCRFYCMLNMFRAILCPSSGAREYYTDGPCLWYLVLWFSGCRYGVELKVMCPVCRLLPAACKPDINKICNKYHLLHLVGILFPHINDDARSESLQLGLVHLKNDSPGMSDQMQDGRYTDILGGGKVMPQLQPVPWLCNCAALYYTCQY